MRLLAGLLALAVAAQAMTGTSRPGYRAGEQYSYDYRGISLSGVPLGSNDRTGIAIWSKVYLHFKTNTQVVLQLENPTVRQMNLDRPSEFQQLGYIPSPREAPQYYSPLPAEVDTLARNYLNQPLVFTLGQDGIVRDLQATEGEPEWIFNVKKGVVNQFQIQTVHNYQQKTEDTIIGAGCLVNYDIVSLDQTVYNITKEYTLRSCDQASRFYDVIGVKGQLMDEHDDILRTSFVSRLQVVRQNNRDFVKTCVSESRFTLRPFEPEHGEIVTYTRQELNYIESSRSQLQMPTNIVKRYSTLYSSLVDPKNPAVSVYSFSHLLTDQQRVQMIKDQLVQIGQQIVHEDHWQVDQHSEIMMNVVQLMRSLTNKGQFVDILNYCLRPEYEYKLRPIVVSAFSYCGSYGLVQDLPQIYPLLTKAEFNIIVAGLPATHRPSQESVKILRTLVGSVPEPSCRDQLILTIGSLVHDICGQDNQYSYQQYQICTPTFKTEMIQFFTQYYGKCQENVNKLVTLRAIGNSGLEMTSFLETVIYDESCSHELRESAIIAMRRCDDVTKVTQTLMPVYRNERGLFTPELRIVAFTTLIERSPTVDMLTMLTARMHEENCRQVGNFVYSYLRNLVELPTIFEPTKQLVVAAQTILPSIRRFEDGLMYSKNAEYHIATLSRRMAKLIAVNSLNVPTQFLPRSINLRLMSFFSGFYTDLVEVGFRFEGLDRLVENIWKTLYPTATSQDMLTSILGDRFKRELTHIQNFLNEQDVVDRPVEQTRGFIFFRHLGNELGIYHTDRYSIQDMQQISQSLSSLHDTLRWFNVIPLMPTMNLKVQSLLGMPFQAYYHAVAVLDLKSQRINKDDIVARSFTPRIFVKGITRIGTDFGLYKSCVGHEAQLKSVVPFNVLINSESGRLSTEIYLNVRDPQMGQNLIQIELRPVISKICLNLAHVTFENSVEEMVMPASTNVFNYDTHVQGLKMNVMTHLQGFTFRQPMFPLCGRHVFTLQWTSMNNIRPFGVKTIFKIDQDNQRVGAEMMLNPRVPTTSQQMNLGVQLIRRRDSNLPIVQFEVQPLWTEKVYKMFVTLELTRGKINPSYSWLEAGETHPLEMILKAQFGDRIEYNPQKQDLIVKTTLCKSQLQKQLEQLDMQIQTSDCYKCEQNKDQWRNVYCDRCIYKRSWYNEIDFKIFMNKDKLINNELLEAYLTSMTLRYLNVYETSFQQPMDITSSLVQSESSLVRQWMPELLSANKLATLRVISELHPYFTDKNMTIFVNRDKLVMTRIPLLPAFRRLDNLPENRITDVVTDRLVSPNLGSCSVDGLNQIYTFDRVSFTQQPQQSECEQLLVKDCTRDRRFEISTQLVGDKQRSLKILLGEKLLEIVPRGDSYSVILDNQPRQFVNDKVETRDYAISRHQIKSPQNTREYKISIFVKSEMIWCTLLGDLVNVQVPCWMKHQVCGLCGDFDGETYQELVLPNTSQAPNLEHFLQSYSKNCQAGSSSSHSSRGYPVRRH